VSGYVIAVTPVRHRGKALSFVLGGLLTATALGVPFGLLIGQSSWRYPMILVAAMGVVALAGILRGLPRRQLPAGRLTDQLRPLVRPRLVGALLVTTGILTGSFTCFTYAVLILGPSFPAGWMIVVIMFGYGVASALGNAVTGRLADRFAAPRVLTVVLVFLLLNSILGMAGLMLTSAAALAVIAVSWFFAQGIGNGGAAVPQQVRLAGLAPESPAILMALNGSAISLGSALGSALGGLALTAGSAPHDLLGIAAVVLAGTLVLQLTVSRVPRIRP
jgi:predicted MFS family arabinose efflux permease